MLSQRANRLLSLSFIIITAPTAPPTTVRPSTSLLDECGYDQASCHSTTGDDYNVTGANIALMRLQANSHSPLSPCHLLCLTLDLIHF